MAVNVPRINDRNAVCPTAFAQFHRVVDHFRKTFNTIGRLFLQIDQQQNEIITISAPPGASLGVTFDFVWSLLTTLVFII